MGPWFHSSGVPVTALVSTGKLFSPRGSQGMSCHIFYEDIFYESTQRILERLRMSYPGVLFSDVIDIMLTYIILIVIVAGAYPLLNRELLDTVTVKP
jgi:hypothetical protein